MFSFQPFYTLHRGPKPSHWTVDNNPINIGGNAQRHVYPDAKSNCEHSRAGRYLSRTRRCQWVDSSGGDTWRDDCACYTRMELDEAMVSQMRARCMSSTAHNHIFNTRPGLVQWWHEPTCRGACNGNKHVPSWDGGTIQHKRDTQT